MIKTNARPWYLQFNYLAVFVYIIFTATLTVWGKTKLIGGMLILAAIARYVFFYARCGRRKMPVPLSLKFYTAWFSWCLITGPLVAVNMGYFWSNIQVLFMVVVSLWCGYILFSTQRQDSVVYTALFIIAILNVIAVKMGVELVREGDVQGLEVTGRILGESRISGLKGNANGLGILFLGGVWGGMMLWNEMRSSPSLRMVVIRVIIFVFMALFSYLIGQTGSRKSFLTDVILWIGWALWVVPGRITASSFFVRVFLAICVGIVAVSIVAFFMDDTLVGTRMHELFDAGGGSALAGVHEDIRWQFVLDGMRMLKNNPIAGVGYMQYIVNSVYGMFAHSDYIEQLASTGLVGFLIYQGFGLSIICKLWKLLKYPLPPAESYKIRGMILFMITNHYLMCFGATFAAMHYHVLILLSFDICAERIAREYLMRFPVPNT